VEVTDVRVEVMDVRVEVMDVRVEVMDSSLEVIDVSLEVMYDNAGSVGGAVGVKGLLLGARDVWAGLMGREYR
jgi:hypothetical protein